MYLIQFTFLLVFKSLTAEVDISQSSWAYKRCRGFFLSFFFFVHVLLTSPCTVTVSIKPLDHSWFWTQRRCRIRNVHLTSVSWMCQVSAGRVNKTVLSSSPRWLVILFQNYRGSWSCGNTLINVEFRDSSAHDFSVSFSMENVLF